MEEELLKDYVATYLNPKYNGDWDLVNSKFPELSGLDKQLLKDYVATYTNPKYNNDWDVVNSKFPELFPAGGRSSEPVKKKNDITESPLGDGSSASSASADDLSSLAVEVQDKSILTKRPRESKSIIPSESTKVVSPRIPQTKLQPDEIDRKLEEIQQVEINKKTEEQKSSKELENNPIISFGKKFWETLSKQIPSAMEAKGAQTQSQFVESDIRRLKSIADVSDDDIIEMPSLTDPRGGNLTRYKAGEYKKQLAEKIARGNKAMQASIELALKLNKDLSNSDVISSLTQVNDGYDLLNFISSSIGQTVAQVPLSLATGGGMSYAMESGNIYLETVKEIAEKEGITPVQVIQQGKDQAALAEIGGAISGALDLFGATKILSAFGLDNIKKDLRKRALTILVNSQVEGVTEVGQEIVSSAAKGIGVEGELKAPTLTQALDAYAAGMFGAAGVQSPSLLIKSKKDVSEEIVQPVILNYGDSKFGFIRDDSGRMEMTKELDNEEQAISMSNMLSKAYKGLQFTIEEVQSSDPYKPTKYRIVANEVIAQREAKIAELSKTIEDDDTATELNLSTKLPTDERQRIEKQLQDLNQEQDAVQEQAAGQVPVQPTTTVGQEVEQGVPQAEPQVAAQEGQAQEKINEINKKRQKELDSNKSTIPKSVTIVEGVDLNGEPTRAEVREMEDGSLQVRLLDKDGKRLGVINTYPKGVSVENAVDGVIDTTEGFEKSEQTLEEARLTGKKDKINAKYDTELKTLEQAEPQVAAQEGIQEEINEENIILSGLRDGFQAVTRNSFDLRSDAEVTRNVRSKKSFTTSITKGGKKYLVVGLKLNQDVGATTSGRDGYSFAAIEDNGNLPNNAIDVLTQKAISNISSIYPNINNPTIDLFSPIEGQEVAVSSRTQPAAAPAPVVAPAPEPTTQLGINDIQLSFAPSNVINVETGTREDTSGRKLTYKAAETSPVTDKEGTPIGFMTKRSDSDGKLSFTVKDSKERNINKGKAYPTERDARVALVEQVNKQRTKQDTYEALPTERVQPELGVISPETTTTTKQTKLKGPVGVSPKREQIKSSIQRIANVGLLRSAETGKQTITKQEIDAQMALTDAMAKVWQETSGKDDFYETFFEDVKEGDIEAIKQKGGALFQNTEQPQLPVTRVTLAVFELPEFQKMKGNMVAPQAVSDLMKSRGKQIEKDIVNTVLSYDKYQGQKRISFDDFKDDVETQLMKLERIDTNTYASYGMDNLGDDQNYGAAQTIIFNSPIDHGQFGHFRGDFNNRAIQITTWNIRQVPNTEQYVAIDANMPAGVQQNEMAQYVGTAGPIADVQRWVNDRNNISKRDINVGLFGHIRNWFNRNTGVYTLAELQSDYFQKNKANDLYASKIPQEEIDEYVNKNFKSKLDNETREIFKKELSIKTQFVLDEKGDKVAISALTSDGDILGLERIDIYAAPPIGYDVIENAENRVVINAARTLYSQDSDFTDRYIELRDEYEIKRKEIKKEEYKYIAKRVEEIKRSEAGNLMLSQFVASQKVHELRLFRESLKHAADKGATELWFPTPYTIAVIEGYVSDKGTPPYEIISGDGDYLEPGDLIDYGGTQMIVVQSFGDSITVAARDSVSIYDIDDLRRDEVDNRMNELENHLNGQVSNLEAITRQDAEEYEVDEWMSHNVKYELDSYFENNPDEETVSWNKIERDVRDRVEKEYDYMTPQDLVSWAEEIYEDGDTIYTIDERGTTENLGQPSDYQSDVDETDFEDNLSSDQSTVVNKYGELGEMIRKMRPDAELVRDNNGKGWIRTAITAADGSNPIIAFQEEGGKIKGAIDFSNDNKASVYVFDGADISTLTHEMSGHLGRRVLEKLAETNNDFAKDYETAKKWAGVEDNQWTRAAEEKWARAFERYLRSGKAPSKSLKNVFEKLGEWLTNIYKTIKGSSIDIKLTPSITSVFDNLLATKKEQGKEVDVLEDAFDFLDKIDKGISKTLKSQANEALLGIPLTVIQGIVKGLKVLVRGGMKLSDAIKQMSKENNITQEKLKDILDLGAITQEFNTLMDKADKLITNQKSKDIPEKRIVSNLDAMVRKFYKDLDINDAQRKLMEREARARMGVAPRKAASIGRVLGVLKDIANVTREEKLKIISRIRELGKDVGKDLAIEIRELAASGKITANQAASIVARTLKINLLNETSVSSFVDYMAKVFDNANYAADMTELRKLQKQAKRKKHTSMKNLVDSFTSINPELIPLDRIQEYKKALDFLNNLTPFYGNMNEMLADIESYKEVNEFDAVKTKEALQEKYKSIKLNEVKNVEEYRNLIKDINSFKRKAAQLLENGDINQEKYDEFIELVGTDQAKVEKNYKDEITKIKKDLIAEIKKQRPKVSRDFSNVENDLIRKYLELSDADLQSLSPEELFILNDLLENISNGEMDVSRFFPIVSKAYTSDGANKLTKQIDDSKFDMTPEEGMKELSEYESSFWEGLLGMGRAKSGALQKFVVSVFNRAIASYENLTRDGYNEFLKLKNRYKMSDKDMHRLGILTTYLQEYMAQFDSNNEGIKDIGNRDWFKEILSSKSMRGKYSSGKPSILKVIGLGKSEIDIIEEIWNSLPKDKDGNVDPKAVYDSYMANDEKFFTKKQKAFFDDVMEYKESEITPKQKFANELSGASFKEIPFHMMRVRLDGGKTQITPTASSDNGVVRIKAGTGKERVSEAVGPIMTNFEKLFIKNLEQTGRDYFLSGALKDINNTLSGAKKKINPDKMPLLDTISGTLSEALGYEFDKTQSNFILRALLSARAAQTLLRPIRTAVELFSSFSSYPVRAKTVSGYKSLFGEQGAMKKLLEFTNSPMLLRENISKAIDINDGRIEPQGRFTKATNYLSGLPERTMMVTSWMPTFKSEFKTITGIDFDMKKFNDSEAYREKYGKAIRESSAAADAQTEKIIGPTTKAGQRREVRIAPRFLANLFGAEGTVSKNTTEGQILGFFSNYPYRELTEFINGFREAAEVLNDEGALSSLSQLQKPLGVALNVAAYSFLSSATYALSLMLLGDDDDEERGEDLLKALLTGEGLLEELKSNAISLAGSRYAAGGKALIQLAATILIESTDDEEQKAKIKKLLKDSVFIDPLPVDKAIGFKGEEEVAGAIGKFIPQFIIAHARYADFIGTLNEFEEIYDKVKSKGVDALTEDESLKVLALNTLFNVTQLVLNFRYGTSIPEYNYIKTYMKKLKEDAGVADVYKGEPPAKKKSSGVGGGSSRGKGMNKTDLKKYNRELYNQMYGTGSATYEIEQEVKAFEKEQRELKKKMKDELFGGKD